MYFQRKTKCIWQQSAETPGVGVPILMGTWALRASSPSSRACSSWWKSVFSFAPPAPSALRALPPTVNPHQMSWRKKKYWKAHKIKDIEKLTGVRGKVLLGAGRLLLALWIPLWCGHRAQTSPVSVQFPITLRAGLFPARIMSRNFVPHYNSLIVMLWTIFQL